jgi:LysM repeat protein
VSVSGPLVGIPPQAVDLNLELEPHGIIPYVSIQRLSHARDRQHGEGIAGQPLPAAVLWLALVLLILLVGCDSVLTPEPTPTPTPAPTYAPGMATPTVAPGSYLTPIPPTPTFTPSPTPTPVVHVVERGDSLFGIAIEYGVTVSGLVRTNGLNEADYLSIGQTLVIPVEEEEESIDGEPVVPQGQVILPTPTPLALATGGISLYHTPVGGLWCMGEVLNTTGGPVTNLHIEVTLLAPDGTPLQTARTLAAADYLAPDARAPFSILFRRPPEGVADVEVRLIRGEEMSAITAGFVPVTIVGAEGAVSGPQYRVRGTLVNESGRNLTRVAVVATIYGPNGQVAGYRQIILPNDVLLLAGGQHTFDLLLTPQVVDAPSVFSVIAWGTQAR